MPCRVCLLAGRYVMTTYIITDPDSLAASEYKLRNIDAVWEEPMVLPIGKARRCSDSTPSVKADRGV